VRFLNFLFFSFSETVVSKPEDGLKRDEV